MKLEKVNEGKGSKKKMIVLFTVLVFIAACIYAVNTYFHYSKGLAKNDRRMAGNPGRPDGPPENMQRPNRQEMRDRMTKDLNLTPEQLKQMDKLQTNNPPASPEEGRKRMEEMQKILTPEQQEKMRSTMQQNMGQRRDRMISRQLEKAEKVLPPDQLDLFKQKLEDRKNNPPRMRGGMPGGEPGGNPQRPDGQNNKKELAAL